MTLEIDGVQVRALSIDVVIPVEWPPDSPSAYAVQPGDVVPAIGQAPSLWRRLMCLLGRHKWSHYEHGLARLCPWCGRTSDG